MSKLSIQTELNVNNLIGNIARLKIKDLESLAQELNAIITRRKTKDPKYREAELLSLHNQTTLPKKKQQRFSELIGKMEAETMDETERAELLALAKEDEKLRNERVKILIELSQLRGTSLPQLMEQIGLNPPADD